MRLKLSRFRRNFNKDLPIEFTEQNLSSFGGLELFSRYLRRVELKPPGRKGVQRKRHSVGLRERPTGSGVGWDAARGSSSSRAPAVCL